MKRTFFIYFSILFCFLIAFIAYKNYSSRQIKLTTTDEITFDDSCPPLEKQIKDLIEKGNVCNIDQDCVINNFGCPFGCYTLTHKDAVSKIEEGVAKFDASCSHCEFRCASPPTQEEVKCINNRCTDTKFNY